MGKKKSATAALAPFGGSMVVSSNPAKRKNLKQSKWFMSQATVLNSQQALSATQTPFEVGSQINGTATNITVSDLGTDAVNWVQRYDEYTIEDIEIFVTLTARLDDGSIKSVPVIVWTFEDRDSPKEVLCNWDQVRDRQNLSRVTLRANNPSLCTAKIKPVPLFDGGVSDNDPSNIVPTDAKWVDSLAVRQRFNGVRIFTACPQKDTQGQSYSYSIYVEQRVKVTGRAAL